MTMDYEKFINLERFTNYASLLPLVIYIPFGLVLGIVRLFIFLHAILLSLGLPDSLFFKRFVIRVMLSVTGLPISVQGKPGVNKNVIIANSISNLDPFFLAFLCPNILVSEAPQTQKQQFHLKCFDIPANKNREEVTSMTKEKANGSELPLLFFPERFKTNGKNSLLKFSLLPFELGHPIQPVTLQTTRFLFNVAVSTVSSTLTEDLFWCLVLPMTVFTIKYLPISEKKRDENCSDFATRVQANVAKSLGVTALQVKHYDVIEYVKRKKSALIGASSRVETLSNTQPTSEVSQNEPSSSSVTKDEDSELQEMMKQILEVLPDASQQIILNDLKKTRDVDATITNIVEGKAEAPSQKEPSCSESPNSKTGQAFKASTFEKNASQRQMSFAERKKAMLEAARAKYKEKHGL